MEELRRYIPTKLCNGSQMAIFGDYFASCICREPRAARFRPASEIRTKATPCVDVWQTSNLRRLRLGEEKKKEETTGQKYIMVCRIHRATIKKKKHFMAAVRSRRGNAILPLCYIFPRLISEVR